MLIIIEGPDGAGKSHLAEKLRSELRRWYRGDLIHEWHSGVPKAHPLDEYLRPLTGYRPASHEHIIADRWHWGEQVYPKVRDRHTDMTPGVRWYIDAYLRRLGAVVVLCHPSLESFEDAFAARPADQRWQLAELPAVRKLFEEVYVTSPLRRLQFDYQSAERGIEDILTAARLAEIDAATAVPYESVTYVGPPHPAVLLAGDVRHGFNLDPECCGTNEFPRDPAFVPFRATSGAYLIDALQRTPYAAMTGLINACDVDEVNRVWHSLGKPRVVALGRNACRCLDKLNVPHGSVPHPQYVRRFHHKQIQRYADDIVKAAHEQRSIDWPSSFPVLTVATSTQMSSTTSAPTDAGSSLATESSATSIT